ncbi:hypothetical protein C8R44DRAFT_726098 [Mycena epipterygia]|nr:hypothetical protein C8R44DRAFT_726098 [Mycena epipterygia]
MDQNSAMAVRGSNAFRKIASSPNAEPEFRFRFSNLLNLEPEPRVQFGSVQVLVLIPEEDRADMESHVRTAFAAFNSRCQLEVEDFARDNSDNANEVGDLEGWPVGRTRRSHILLDTSNAKWRGWRQTGQRDEGREGGTAGRTRVGNMMV